MNPATPNGAELPNLIGSGRTPVSPGADDYDRNRIRLLESILNATAQETYLFDRSGRMIFVNAAGAETVGMRPDELLGRTAAEVGAPEHSVVRFDAERETVFNTAARLAGEVEFTALDGKREYEYTWTPILAEDGSVTCALFACRNVTEQKRAEAALSREERLLKTTLRSIGDAVLATDLEGRISFMNPIAEELTGWFEAEAIGRHCREVFHIINENSRMPVDNPVERVLSEGAVVGLANHTLLIARDGAEHPIADSGAPIRDENNTLFGAVLVFRDVTEQSRAQAAQERLAAIVASSNDAIVSKDLNGIVASWNKAAEKLYGYAAEEIIGRSKSIVIPEDQPDELPNILRHLRSGRSLAHYETRRVRKSGEIIDVSISVSPLRDSEGAIIGGSTIVRDITAQKRAARTRAFLTEASQLLGSSLDYVQTLQSVADLAVPDIADWCAVDTLEPDQSIRLLGVSHVNPEKTQWAYTLRQDYPPEPGQPGLVRVLETGKSEIYGDITDEMLVAGARDAEHLAILRSIGFRSAMIVPILARERVLGAITFVTTWESRRLFDAEDLALAEGLAARAALAIENARLYQEAQAELLARERAQEALQRSEDRFRLALTHSDIIVYVQDQDLRYTWVYDGASNREETQVYGRTDLDIMSAQDAEVIMAIKRRVLRSGAEERHVIRATMTGRESRFLDTSFAPVYDSEGNIVGITGVANDVTEQKRSEDVLMQHQHEIEALNARLQRSMRETHHRVKNNLQVISALVNLQQMQYDDHVPASELERIVQHVRALASIHDLLSVQAQTDAVVEDVSVAQVMSRLLPTLQGMANGREVSMEVDDLQLPVRLSTALAVLVNEIGSNAWKHGAGKIAIRLREHGDSAELEVTDEGPGFPPNFHAPTAANTGLDLIGSIAQMDLRGTVRYENAPTGGARVVVEFPIFHTERASARP